MSKIFIAIVLLLAYARLDAQNLMSQSWKFSTGDNLKWSELSFDDSAWPSLKAGQVWESQGYPSYDGFAWYRQHIVVASKWKELAQKNGGLEVYVGRIDDCDEAYWNGERIGKSGDFPPTYKEAYGVDRLYKIPFEKINWDKDNLLSVRVFDNGGGGGFYFGTQYLKVVGIADYVTVSPIFKRNDQIFEDVAVCNFDLEFKNTSNDKIAGQYKIEITTDFGEPVTSKTAQISIKKAGSFIQKVELGALKPGFYKSVVTFQSKEVNVSRSINFGVSPTKIESPANRPADFEAFWNRAKRELAAVDPQFKIKKIDSLSNGKKDWYLVEMRSLGNVPVKAWYGRPTKAGRYPAVLHVQGYSTTAVPSWGYADDDVISLVLNIRGHGNSKDAVNPGFSYPGYLQYFLNDKELYIYRGAYMDCTRAVDFLFSRAEVDTAKVAVEGGSQGGALSFATAALNNNRICYCMPNVPFLSDFQDYFKVASWPGGEMTRYASEHPDYGMDKVLETLSYFDIKNLAGWIKCPLFMASGLKDDVCPPHINFAAYNQVTTPKEYVVYPESGHGLCPEYGMLKKEKMRKQLGLK